MNKSCLNCSKFMSCDYTNKRASYFCDKWKGIEERDDLLLVFDDDEAPLRASRLILPENSLLLDEKKLDTAFDKMEDYLDEALANKLPVPKDFKFDDRDLPLAKNMYDFITHPTNGFKESTLFSRQLWMATKLFGEWCYDCTKARHTLKGHSTKRKNPMRDIKNIKIGASMEDFTDKVQLLEHGICPSCGQTKLDLYKGKKLKFYTELAVCAGQRSGKSIVTSFLFAYHTHRLLKLQKPAQLLTGASNTLLTISMVSIDKGGVMRNLWMPYYAALEDSRWFQEYHGMLDHYGKKYGEEGYKKMDTFLHYKHRRMYIHPTVPNQRGLRGATRAGSAIDEVGWFDANSPDKITLSADGIYEALNRSMLTVRASARKLFKQGYFDIPTGFSFNISSPASTDDKIMQLVTKHSHSKTVLAVHVPTWEMNPHVPRRDPEIQKAYSEDPIAADRDYGANPPAKNGTPFFSNYMLYQDSFTSKKNAVEYTYVTKKSEKEDGKIYKAAEIKAYPASIVSGSVLAIDASFSDNSFAISVAHRQEKKLVFDVLLEIIPDKGRNVLNHARIVKSVIEPLIRAFNVKYVVADRWNSLFLLHKLMEGFPSLVSAEQYSVKYADFLAFKSYVENQGALFPRLESDDTNFYVNGMGKEGQFYPNMFDYKPVCHLFYQMNTVQDAKKTVEKGHKKTDDLFRSVVLASSYLLDEDVTRHLTEKRVNSNRGIVALAGGGGGSTGVIVNSRGKGIAAM